MSSAHVSKRWFIDVRGRIGYVTEDRWHYAYGDSSRPPRVTLTYAADGESLQGLFGEQRAEMWHEVERLITPLTRLAAKAARGDSELAAELLTDVGVPAACLAAVTYDPQHVSGVPFDGWVCACARLAYKQALSLAAHRRERQHDAQTAKLQQLAEEIIAQGRHISARCELTDDERGQLAKQELLSLGLTEQELALLEARFCDGKTLEELQGQLGVLSKSSVKNHIDRILKRIR